MFRPIAYFCLRYSITVQEALEMMKIAFVRSAADDLERRNARINHSRLCVATGIHRQEIARILSGDIKPSTTSYSQRIIGQWLGDKRFQNKACKPRVLSCDDDNCEFYRLVRHVCTDVHPRTLLAELERVGAVERSAGGVKLLARAYVPKENPQEGYKLFAEDSTHLLCAIEENVTLGIRPPNLHVRTEFDNVDRAALPKIRHWFYRFGNEFHEQARAFVSKFDLDLNPKDKAVGNAKVVLGSFSRIMDSPDFENRRNDEDGKI